MFIGVVNKILDHLMEHTLKHFSRTIVTKWMVQKPASGHSCGARAMDYEMKEVRCSHELLQTPAVFRLGRSRESVLVSIAPLYDHYNCVDQIFAAWC